MYHNKLLLLACHCSPQAGRTPQKFQGIFPASVKRFCLFNFPLLKLIQFKGLTLFELESTSSAFLNMPHKGDGFLGNRNVAKKKKNPWKHVLPTSFPSALSTAVCQAQKLQSRQESLLLIS